MVLSRETSNPERHNEEIFRSIAEAGLGDIDFYVGKRDGGVRAGHDASSPDCRSDDVDAR